MKHTLCALRLRIDTMAHLILICVFYMLIYVCLANSFVWQHSLVIGKHPFHQCGKLNREAAWRGTQVVWCTVEMWYLLYAGARD